MNADGLIVTSHVGERRRVGGWFVADALMDLHAAHGVAAGILLRGAAGFGLSHHLRSDASLTLSEDLPMVAMAVDTADRIEALLDRATVLSGPGLITLERVRMLTGAPGAVALPDELRDAAKLTVHMGRGERCRGRPAHVAVCRLLHRCGMAGATALVGVDGTVAGRRRRARFIGANRAVPAMVVAVGDGERIARVVPEIGRLVRRPVMTLERVRVCKRDGATFAVPRRLPVADERGMALWQRLTVFTSEADRHGGRSLHRAIIDDLRAAGALGATAVRGVWGFHGDHEPHGDRLFQLGRRVPVATAVVDSPARIARWFAVIDALTREHGLVICETVPAMYAMAPEGRRGGLGMARRRP